MKNFMVLIALVALLSGCSTPNPYYQDLQVGTGTMIGALVGASLAKNLGGNTTAGGVVGAIGGHDVVKGAQWKPPVAPVGTTIGNARVIVVDGRAVSYQSQSLCPSYWDSDLRYQMPEGFRRDERSGGITKLGCGQPVASAGSAFGAVYSKNTAAKKEVLGPTIHNYMDDPMIPKECRKGNPGGDAFCMRNLPDDLDIQQKVCEGEKAPDGVETTCPMDSYNPGKWAGIYRRLIRELKVEQARVNRG